MDVDSTLLISFLALTLSLIVAYNQIKLQKKNLKLQLFEKRFALYESILKTKTLIDLDNSYNQLYSTLINLEEGKYNKSFLEINNTLLYEFEVSKFLFDDSLARKIRILKGLFSTVNFEFKMVCKSYNHNFKNENRESIKDILYKFSLQYKHELETNNLYNEIGAYKKMYAIYLNYIDRSGILKDFDKYLDVSDL